MRITAMSKIKELIIKYRRLIILLVHVLLIAAAYIAAFYVRFEFALSGIYMKLLLTTLPFLIIIKAVIFHWFGLYAGMWRYVSMHDVVQILKANIASTAAFVLFIMIWRGLVGFPRSIFLMDFVLCVGFVSGVRFLSRSFRERLHPLARRRNVRVAIVGAGEAGIMVLKELMNSASYDIAGFIDDDRAKKNMRIYGAKVLGTTDEIKNIVKKHDIEELVIAIPSASGKAVRDIVSKCEKTEARIKIAPGFHKILTGEITIKQIRDVKPEDLLGRETVQINTKDLDSFIRDKVVLITGAGGSIGSELCRQIARFNPRMMILYDHNENHTHYLELELAENFPSLDFRTIIGDIKDIGLLKYTFSKYRPQIVFHSAAHKHVALMEENPVAAVKNNIMGTRNFMYAADHYGVESFVMISTDKAVNPTSVMGASKRIAEMIIQAKAQNKARAKFMAVRFGNVIGSSGSVVPIFKKQIENGGPVTVTDPEVKRFFMTASEAAQLVLQAGAIGKGGEIFILDMGEQIRIVDLAKNLITLSGLEPGEDIEIKYIGLRPGEKMQEEMLRDKEHDKATRYDKIYIAQPDDFDPRRLRRDIKTLERAAILMDKSAIIDKIKEMIPSYKVSKGGS